ncbi:MAG: GNAT family N-acetyltransferase [Acidimicrobiales bacterium]
MTEIVYRQIEPAWAEQLEAIELAAFPNVAGGDLYNADSLRLLAQRFPEGCFVAFDGANPVGMGLGVLLDFDFDHIDHSAAAVYNSHDADGDWYYGTTIAVLAEYRGRGIGRDLYQRRKEVVRRLNKKGIVAGGVLPGYADHKDVMSAEDYLAKVAAGELYDPTLTFQMENGFQARAVLNDYMQDATVGNHACLIVWENPDYRE